MKTFRLLAAALFASTFVALAPAEDTSEIAALRAKAEHGNGIAQYNLGLAYAEGRGVPADRLEAFVWLSLARQNGARGRALDTLVASFDRNTFEAAQQRLAERKAAPGAKPPAAVVTPAPEDTPAIADHETKPAPPATDGTAAQQAATLTADKKQLAAELAAAWKENDSLKTDAAKMREERDALTGQVNRLAGQISTSSAAEQQRAQRADAMAAELARTKQALAALQSAPKPAADPAALAQKTRELQAAQLELENAGKFSRELEASVNRLNEGKAALEKTLAASQAEATRMKSDLADQSKNAGGRVENLTAQLAQAQQKLADLQTRSSSADQQNSTQLKAQAAELAQLRAGQNEITAKAQRLAEENASLGKSLAAKDTASARVHELETALAAATQRADAGEAERTRGQKDLSAAAAKIASAESQAAALGREKLTLTGQSDELRHQLDAAKGQLADLQARSSSADQQSSTQLKAQAAELAQLRAGRNETTAKAQRLAEEKASLEQSLAAKETAAAARVRELEASLAAATQRTDAGEAERLRNQKDLSATAARIAAAESQTAALGKEKLALAGQTDELRHQLDAAKGQLAEARQKAAALETASRAPSAETVALRGQLASAQSELKELSSVMAAQAVTTAKLGAAEQYAAKLEAQVGSLEQQNAHLAQQYNTGETMTRKLAELTGELGTLKQSAAALQTELAAAKSQVTALGTERDAARRAQADVSGKLARTEQENSRLTASLSTHADTAQQLAQLGEKAATGEKQAAGLRQERDALAAKLAELTGEVTQLRGDRDRMQKLLADTGKKLRDTTTEAARVKELETQAAGQQTTLTAAQAQVTALTAERDAARNAQSEMRTQLEKIAQDQTQLTAALEAARKPDRRVEQAVSRAENLQKELQAESTRRAAAESSLAQANARLTAAAADLAAATAGKTESATQLAALGKVKADAEQAAKAAAGTEAGLRATIAALEQEKAQLTTAKNSSAETARTVAGLNEKLSAGEKQAAALRQERDTLATKLAGLTGELNQLRGDRDRTQKLLADTGRKLRDSTADAARLKELETQAANSQSALTAAQARIDTLQNSLTAAKNAAPAYPDYSGRVHELEGLLAAAGQKSESLAKSSSTTGKQAAAELTAAQAELTRVKAELVRAQQPVAPAYPDLSGRVHELEGKAAETETALQAAAADSARQLAAANSTQAELKNKLADTTAALQKARGKQSGDTDALRRERDEQAGRVTALTSDNAQLRADRERMQKLLADAGKQARDASAAASRVKELETQAASAQSALTAAQTRIETLQSSLTSAKSAAPAYPDYSGRVHELEGLLAAADQKAGALAKASTTDQQAVADSDRKLAAANSAQAELKNQLADTTAALQKARGKQSGDTDALRRERDEQAGRVTALTSDNTQLRADRERMQKLLADAGKQARDASASASRIKELEEQLFAGHIQIQDAGEQILKLKESLTAAKNAAPAYPDLSGRVRELQALLAAPKTRAPSYPNLAGRVSDLETALADSKRQLGETQAALKTAEQVRVVPMATAEPAAEQTELAKKLADTEDRLAISLRGFAALERERDQLAAEAGKSTAAVSADKDALAGRVSAAESRATEAQAEAARLNESLAALQRSTGHNATELASARTLLLQVQGANAVLASENYRLKALVGRNASPGPAGTVTPVPVAMTAPAPVAAPAAAQPPRTYVVVAGDSLSRLSRRFYGTPNRWLEIFNANRAKVGSDGALRIGTELRIP